jgi:hypothetical protein
MNVLRRNKSQIVVRLPDRIKKRASHETFPPNLNNPPNMVQTANEVPQPQVFDAFGF